jgi:hypothetical protein
MSIEAEILDKRIENSSTCYLSKINLFQYLSNLPENYKDYDIQREVVSTNVYLDKIIDTILEKKHIPTIVLTLENFHSEENILKFKSIDYKILDGLQRTHRLKIIFDTIKLLSSGKYKIDEISQKKKFELSKLFSEDLRGIKSNIKILSKILEYYQKTNKTDLDSIFKENFIWFELWTNLDSKQQVEKMLLLNAGHKPVKLKHQLELLFINDLIKDFKESSAFSNFDLIREKDMNSTSFSKNRKAGQFHFSQVISALIAFDQGRPLVTNASLINKVQENEYTIQDLNNELSYDFISNVVQFLLKLDEFINNNYSGNEKWLGRETSLVGIFASLGKYRNENEDIDPNDLFNKLIDYLNKNTSKLNINEFDEARKVLDLSKINYGNVNRRVVFDAFNNILKEIDNPGLFPNQSIEWKLLFKKYANHE